MRSISAARNVRGGGLRSRVGDGRHAPAKSRTVSLPPDPYRDLDARADPDKLIQSLELRARTPSHARLRRRFLDFVGLQAGDRVLDVGCGTGVVLRDVAARVGRSGHVVGIDPSRRAIAFARALARAHRLPARVTLRVGDGLALPFGAGRFDAVLAVTVALHVADPEALVREMVRVVKPDGRVGLQDQDFGTLAVTHPDRDLTDHILRGVVGRMYEEPYSGRRLLALLQDAGLAHVRLRTDVYQDMTLEPYSKGFLERRAELGVRFGLVDAATAQRWLDGFTALVAAGHFLMTLNFYGVVGVRSSRASRR